MASLKLKQFLSNNSFILLIITVLVFSILFPGPGLFINRMKLVSYLIFVAMFVSGLGLSIGNIRDGLKDYKSILFSFLSVYLFFPVIAYLILLSVNIRTGDIFVGSMILAAQSSTLASAVVLTASANGNTSLALIITIINNMASAVFTPLVLKATLSLNEPVDFDVSAMIVKLLAVLILPVLLSQFIRYHFSSFVLKTDRYRKTVSKFVVLVIVLSGAAAASSRISDNLMHAALIVAFVSVLHLVMLLISTLYMKIAGVKKDNRAAVLFTSSQKTLPASLFIWANYFSRYTLSPIVLVLYHIVQLIIDSYIAGRLGLKKYDTDQDKS